MNLEGKNKIVNVFFSMQQINIIIIYTIGDYKKLHCIQYI